MCFVVLPIKVVSASARPVEKKGVVYTKPWVVDLILDLVGFRTEEDLAARFAVEPAAGEGAFLLPMVRRLITSIERHGRRLADAKDALRAHELDADTAARVTNLVVCELIKHGVTNREALDLAQSWIAVGDYLIASQQSRPADYVVGNPPYIRYDDIPADIMMLYRRLYPTMTGRCDIYVAFIEAATRQLANGGVLGFICADRWMRSAYGTELRRWISRRCGVEMVIEMHDAPAFEEDVAAYPAVIIARRGKQREAIVASANANAGSLKNGGSLAKAIVNLASKRVKTVPGISAARLERWFDSDGGPWPSVAPDKIELLQSIEASCASLEDATTGTRVGIGVATGADQVFVTTDPELVETDRLLPLAMAADTRRGRFEWSGHYLIDPWNRDGSLVDLEQYPQLKRYLDAHRAYLERRNIAQRGRWYQTIDRVFHHLTTTEKLYFPDMKLVSNPTLDRGETYPHHNLYYVTSRSWDLEVLGGIMLSRIAQLFIEAYCVKMRGGTLRFQAQYLRRIRVPRPETLTPVAAQRLREAFRNRDVANATEAAIDAYAISDRGLALAL